MSAVDELQSLLTAAGVVCDVKGEVIAAGAIERARLRAVLRLLLSCLPRCEYVDRTGPTYKLCANAAVVHNTKGAQTMRCRSCPAGISARRGSRVELPWAAAVREAEAVLSGPEAT